MRSHVLCLDGRRAMSTVILHRSSQCQTGGDRFGMGLQEKQYAPACAHLGELYMAGVGTKETMPRRKRYLKKFRKAKDAYGCSVEGDLFYNGWGVEQDYLEAHARFSKGCQQGYTCASRSLSQNA